MMSDELTRIADFQIVTDLFARFDCTPVDDVMPLGAVMGGAADRIGCGDDHPVELGFHRYRDCTWRRQSHYSLHRTAACARCEYRHGTTVTVQLAANPANRVAKQATLAHTLFNVIGTVVMLVFFYVPWGNSRIPVFFHIVPVHCTAHRKTVHPFTPPSMMLQPAVSWEWKTIRTSCPRSLRAILMVSYTL